LHIHLACAFPNVEGAEFIPRDSGADPLEALLLDCPEVQDGRMKPREEPGVGIQIDWQGAERSAKRVTVITADN
jgi:hypothetical protein